MVVIVDFGMGSSNEDKDVEAIAIDDALVAVEPILESKVHQYGK